MTQTALVTGSSGFIGRHMVQELSARGWDVYGWDIADVDRRGRSGDVLRLWGEHGGDRVFDLVVHCAYHVGGREAIDGTNTNFAKNLQLDSALFEWAVRTRQKRVLYFSSSAAYPVELQQQACPQCGSEHCQDMSQLFEWHIDFDDPKLPDANYGWAKLTGERLAADAVRNGLKVSVVRPFSGYGEDQSLAYPFPSIVRRAREGDLTVWGPPGQTRDWIHVDDVVKGALAVVEGETTDPVNLCTGVATEMGELILQVYRETANRAPKIVKYLPDKPTGVFWRVGDPTRLQQYYTPKVSLEAGIRRALSGGNRFMTSYATINNDYHCGASHAE